MENQPADSSPRLAQSNIITSARYELTKMEKNLLYLTMREMKPSDPSSQLYYVSVMELQRRTGEEIKYERLRDITKKMMSRVLEADLPNGDLLQTHFFSSVRYIKGAGTLEIGVDPTIRPYYGYLKSHFTTFHLDVALSLNSIYAKRMYEIFSMYKNMDNKTFRMSVDKLRAQLGLMDKHPLYADLKRSVLDKAGEINTVTDLAFTYREIKLGRKVVELEFTIVYTPKDTDVDYNEQERALFGRMVNDFKLRRDQAMRAIRNHTSADLNKILYQIALLYKEGKVQNIGGYTAHKLGVQ